MVCATPIFEELEGEKIAIRFWANARIEIYHGVGLVWRVASR